MKKKIDLKPYIISAIISLVLGIFIFILIFLILKKPVVDATAIPAIILISASILIWVAREGFFDIFSYGFRQLGTTMFSKKPNEFNNFASYKEMKNEVRDKRPKYYFSVAAIGVLFLVTTLILFLVYKL